MINCDLHTHTSFSQCGCHSVLEMLQFAIQKGLTAMAITDHGPLLKPHTPSTFFDRFENPYNDKIHFFKGMECNYAKELGKIDLPEEYKQYIDVVLLGFHFNTPHNLGIKHYTDVLLKTVDSNKIHIITHPIDHNFPLDLNEIAKFCAHKNVALELNNSKIELNLITPKEQTNLIEICLKHNCPMVVDSDAHTINQIGDDSFIQPLLKELHVPEALIINKTLKKTIDFIKSKP